MSTAERASGFSLIELLITIVVVSILAAIAVPSYQSYTLKSHRTEAKTALLSLAGMEERFLSTNNTYSQAPSDLGYSVAAFPINTVSNYYQITQSSFIPAVAPTAVAPAGTPASYAFTATAIGMQIEDAPCASLTINSNGQKTATGTDPNANTDCWN
jgi:type IV pilus assembly protein PilE